VLLAVVLEIAFGQNIDCEPKLFLGAWVSNVAVVLSKQKMCLSDIVGVYEERHVVAFYFEKQKDHLSARSDGHTEQKQIDAQYVWVHSNGNVERKTSQEQSLCLINALHSN